MYMFQVLKNNSSKGFTDHQDFFGKCEAGLCELIKRLIVKKTKKIHD